MKTNLQPGGSAVTFSTEENDIDKKIQIHPEQKVKGHKEGESYADFSAENKEAAKKRIEQENTKKWSKNNKQGEVLPIFLQKIPGERKPKKPTGGEAQEHLRRGKHNSR